MRISSVNLCDFSPCVNGACVDDKTVNECFRCECPADFTGPRCETSVTTRMILDIQCRRSLFSMFCF